LTCVSSSWKLLSSSFSWTSFSCFKWFHEIILSLLVSDNSRIDVIFPLLVEWFLLEFFNQSFEIHRQKLRENGGQLKDTKQRLLLLKKISVSSKLGVWEFWSFWSIMGNYSLSNLIDRNWIRFHFLLNNATNVLPHLYFNFGRSYVNWSALECIILSNLSSTTYLSFSLNLSFSHVGKSFWGSRHHEVSHEHNEFHELWIINIVVNHEKSCIFAIHGCWLGLVHWVFLGKLDLERNSCWLSLTNNSFLH
jgi:hypothetical protein